jgi:hypothetical protein
MGVENAPAAIGLGFGGFGGGWAADKFSKNIVQPAAEWAGRMGSSLPDAPYARWLAQQGMIGSAQTAQDTDAGRTARQNLDAATTNVDWNTAKTALGNLRGMLPY